MLHHPPRFHQSPTPKPKFLNPKPKFVQEQGRVEEARELGQQQRPVLREQPLGFNPNSEMSHGVVDATWDSYLIEMPVWAGIAFN